MMHPKDTVKIEFRCNTDDKERDKHHNHQFKTGPARNMARRLQFESLDELEAAIARHARVRESGQRVVLPVHCNPCGQLAGATMELIDVKVVPFDGADDVTPPAPVSAEVSELAARLARLEAENAELRERLPDPEPE